MKTFGKGLFVAVAALNACVGIAAWFRAEGALAEARRCLAVASTSKAALAKVSTDASMAGKQAHNAQVALDHSLYYVECWAAYNGQESLKDTLRTARQELWNEGGAIKSDYD